MYLSLLLLAIAVGCKGRPNGAPTSACSSLTPIHSGIEPQRSASPFSVSAIKNGNKVRVTISSFAGDEIEGFILQARSTKDKSRMIDGTFTTRNGATRTINCFSEHQNTLTQVNPSPKSQIISDWTPSESLEDVFFRATVAKSFTEFWTEIDSSPVIFRSDATNMGQTPKNVDMDSQSMYYNCFVSKGCFGYPSGCISRANCEFLLSYVNDGHGVNFTLSGILAPQTYMAMGISNDPLMGNDLVTECYRDNSIVTARKSWNGGKYNERIAKLPSLNYISHYTDGLTTCSWTEKYIVEANNRIFNLANSTYYVLLAKGAVENERINFHSGRQASQEPVNFTAFDAIESEGVSDSIKIHGSSEGVPETLTESTEISINSSTEYNPTDSTTENIKASSNSGQSLSLSIVAVMVFLGINLQVFVKVTSYMLPSL